MARYNGFISGGSSSLGMSRKKKNIIIGVIATIIILAIAGAVIYFFVPWDGLMNNPYSKGDTGFSMNKNDGKQAAVPDEADANKQEAKDGKGNGGSDDRKGNPGDGQKDNEGNNQQGKGENKPAATATPKQEPTATPTKEAYYTSVSLESITPTTVPEKKKNTPKPTKKAEKPVTPTVTPSSEKPEPTEIPVAKPTGADKIENTPTPKKTPDLSDVSKEFSVQGSWTENEFTVYQISTDSSFAGKTLVITFNSKIENEIGGWNLGDSSVKIASNNKKIELSALPEYGFGIQVKSKDGNLSYTVKAK